ncbi:MAG: HAD family hydrolase [Planctomycetaceae bacterium]|nr:HAD family hydrolase [Planctomycetaceae bacterium]
MTDNPLVFDAPVKAVVFDAVGTVIYPQPGVATAYQAAIEKHFGVQIDGDAVSSAVRAALTSRSSADELTTSELQEREFWSDLVRTLCPAGEAFDACFEELFAHFGDAANWRVFDDTAATISGLQNLGLPVAVASNFDDRLNAVCDGLPEVACIDHRIVSSLVGYRKPAGEFFDAVAAVLNLPPEEILMVGDDPTNDVQGARAAGLQAVLIDRSRGESEPGVINRLDRLVALLKTTEVSGRDDG